MFIKLTGLAETISCLLVDRYIMSVLYNAVTNLSKLTSILSPLDFCRLIQKRGLFGRSEKPGQPFQAAVGQCSAALENLRFELSIFLSGLLQYPKHNHLADQVIGHRFVVGKLNRTLGMSVRAEPVREGFNGAGRWVKA